MKQYSRSLTRFERRPWHKFGIAGVAALAAAVLAGCAATAPATAPQAVAEPEPVATAAVDAPAPEALMPGPALRPDAPPTYVVKKGDTLWDIANHFLLNPWEWPEIWYVNDQVHNPHLIYPGDVLHLSELNGRARLGLDLERLSPQIRELPLENAIPTIPFDAIRDFLRSPRLVTPEELAAAPYLLSFADSHLIGGEGTPIYVRQLPANPPSSWDLVRKGQVYLDPDDNSAIGYEATPIGAVDITRPGDPAEGLLTQTYREALVGDRLLPVQADTFQNDFYPHAPNHPIGGRIIAAMDGISLIRQYQIVAINRGTRHGLEPGHVLQILQGGALVDDPYGKDKVRVPDQPAGLILVFKTTPRLSYALVMTVTRPTHVLDKVEKPRSSR